jgi:hypothetical protein
MCLDAAAAVAAPPSTFSVVVTLGGWRTTTSERARAWGGVRGFPVDFFVVTLGD